jgi:hypothetical protein
MTTTLDDVLDRIFRTILYPPDYQPPISHLVAEITDTDTLINLTGFAIPEDENLLRQGTVLEIGTELIRVRDFDEGTGDITIQRALFGTTAVAHDIDSEVILAPPYPRQSTFEYLADNVIQLYPRLYTVSSANNVAVTDGISGMQDALAVEVVSVWQGNFSHKPNIHAEIVDFHPSVGGRALITNVSAGNIWVRYRRRMGAATSVDDTLEELGVDDRWVNILMIGVAADLFAGRDLPASQVEWVSAALEAETIEVGSRADLAVGLARYRELLIDRASKEMSAEYKLKMHQNNPLSMRVRSAIG